MENDHPKYAVLKRDDWIELCEDIENGGGWINGPKHLVEDAEVIRKQDITSAPIFYAYASIVTSYAEILDDLHHRTRFTEWGQSFKKAFDPDKLREIADHFQHAADQASTWPNRKLPD